VGLSRRRKADLESSEIGIQTLTSLTHLVVQKPNQMHAVQYVHSLSRTEIEIQSTVATKPYVETSHMSSQ
jgi:hypothetical protein